MNDRHVKTLLNQQDRYLSGTLLQDPHQVTFQSSENLLLWTDALNHSPLHWPLFFDRNCEILVQLCLDGSCFVTWLDQEVRIWRRTAVTKRKNLFSSVLFIWHLLQYKVSVGASETPSNDSKHNSGRVEFPVEQDMAQKGGHSCQRPTRQLKKEERGEAQIRIWRWHK